MTQALNRQQLTGAGMNSTTQTEADKRQSREQAIRQHRGEEMLRSWGQQRDTALAGLGHAGASIVEKMRREAEGASSGARFSTESETVMTSTERQAQQHSFVLRIEAIVSGLPVVWQQAIAGVYVGGMSQASVAQHLGEDRKATGYRLRDARDEVVRQYDRRKRDLDGVLRRVLAQG